MEGRDIRQMRKDAGLLQSEVAREAGIPLQSLIDLENEADFGERVVATIKRLEAQKTTDREEVSA